MTVPRSIYNDRQFAPNQAALETLSAEALEEAREALAYKDFLGHDDETWPRYIYCLGWTSFTWSMFEPWCLGR